MAVGLTAASIDAGWTVTTARAAPVELSPDGPSYTFSIVGQLVPQYPQYTEIEQPYFGRGGIVEQRSHGRIKFNLSTQSELNLTGFESVRTLQLGVQDFVSLSVTPISTDLPLAQAADLVGMYSDFDVAQRAVTSFLPVLSAITEKHQGIKMLGSMAFEGDVIYCNTPINSLDDLRGKRVRGFGGSTADLLAELGATSVTITFAEVYGALQRGVVECAITGRVSGNSAKWFEVTTHLYDLPIVLAVNVYGVNASLWNSLPEDVQQFLVQIFDEVTEKQWALARRLGQIGLDCNAGLNGQRCPSNLGSLAPPAQALTIVQPSEADRARLKEIAETVVLSAWVQQCGSATLSEDECKRIFNETIGREVGIAIP
jgi:TRAP-type C4-dicarboxylate transport system substrate-binding protein